MALALTGLATGLGARYPRFGAAPTEVAGSYGGVAFMIQAVFYVIIMIVLVGWPSSTYLWARARHITLSAPYQLAAAGALVAAILVSVAVCVAPMRSGVRALEAMDREGAPA
jgi:hypothetical protein